MLRNSHKKWWKFLSVFTLSYKMKQTIEFSMVCDRSIICNSLQYSPLYLHSSSSAAPKMHQNAVFQGFVGGFIHEFPFCGRLIAAEVIGEAKAFVYLPYTCIQSPLLFLVEITQVISYIFTKRYSPLSTGRRL